MGRRPTALLLATVALTSLAVLGTTSPAHADDAVCIASSEQALTLRQQGKFHDALKQLVICADSACPDEVKTECARRIASVGEAMPTVILVARDRAGNDLPAVRVSIDGAPNGDLLDGRPLALDPGTHTFHFEAEGQPPTERTFVLRQSEKNRRETVVLGAAPPPVAEPKPVRPVTADSWSTQKTLALTAGGVGVIGVALGATFGLLASSAKSREQRECPAAGCADRSSATADYDSATHDATLSTVAFGAGAAFLIAGTVLWFTAPRAPSGAQGLKVGPMLLGGRAGLMLGGDL